jgi:predicted polyphosphate/ATP-dependent NAD kinase
MKLGFVINPLAGIGGSVGLKGSDGDDIVELALSRGASLKAEKRASAAVQEFSRLAIIEHLDIITAASSMGEDVLRANGLDCELVYTAAEHTTSADTRDAVRLFVEHDADLIVFVGGDGTARDVLDVLSKELKVDIPVVGIPAGVKIHSAVYAVTPSQAGELINLLISGVPMSLHQARVMDLDEDAFREGEVIARCYGYLSVPVDDTRMQLIKQGGVNHHEIAVQEIATEIIDSMEPDTYYLVGSGSTTAEIMKQLSLANTLLGIDIVYNHELIASDVDEQTILNTIDDHPVKIVVTVIGGQGHVFGRGNQQLSADVIRHVGQENIIIVATNDKLRSLEKRPMISDTGDIDLDRQLSGLYPVVTGYQQQTLYRLK